MKLYNKNNIAESKWEIIIHKLNKQLILCILGVPSNLLCIQKVVVECLQEGNNNEKRGQ